MTIHQIKETISSIIDEVENRVKVNMLKSKIYYNNEYIYQYQKYIKKLKEENKVYEKEMYKTCNHNWVRDYDDLYSRYKVCTKCKLANIPYVYN